MQYLILSIAVRYEIYLIKWLIKFIIIKLLGIIMFYLLLIIHKYI